MYFVTSAIWWINSGQHSLWYDEKNAMMQIKSNTMLQASIRAAYIEMDNSNISAIGSPNQNWHTYRKYCVDRLFAMDRPKQCNEKQNIVKKISVWQKCAQHCVCRQHKVHKCNELNRNEGKKTNDCIPIWKSFFASHTIWSQK